MEEHIFTRIVLLLKEVEWLYYFPVTQVFTRDVFSYMPDEWRSALIDLPVEVLNTVPQCAFQEDWPSSLQQVLEACRKYSLYEMVEEAVNTDHEDAVDLPKGFTHKMSIKKKHEVNQLIGLVKRIRQSANSHHILDIGSGMGYIDSVLHYVLNLTVLGVESKDANVQKALARQDQLSGPCSGITHINWALADDDATLTRAKEIIQRLIHTEALCSCEGNGHGQRKLSCSSHTVDSDGEAAVSDLDLGRDTNASTRTEGSAVVLGLHSCADLSPIMMKIFCNCSDVSSLILVSCCYHKMQPSRKEKSDIVNETRDVDYEVIQPEYSQKTANEVYGKRIWSKIEESKEQAAIANSFINFPMSEMLRNIFKKNNFSMSSTGLRLAAQESGLRWAQQTVEDHENHKNSVVYRALLEIFCEREGYTLKKLRRRCARKAKFKDFEDYIRTVFENYEFVPNASHYQPENSNRNSDRSERCLEYISTEKLPLEISEKENLSEKNARSESTKEMAEDYVIRTLNILYKEYEPLFSLIEPLTGLQLALQPVLEALVLLDRVVYLKESGFTRVWLEKVFNVELSPRCVALIALR